MARLFDAASAQYLEIDQAVVTAVPFTMACWANFADNTDLQYVMALADLSEPDQSFRLGKDTPGNENDIIAVSYDGTTKKASTTAKATAGTWHHICGVFASSTSRAAYLDGGNKGTDTTSSTPTGIDRTSIGRVGDSTPGYDTDGAVAEAAIWNAALTDAEVVVLATGVSPLLVRPQSLVFYMPLIRDDDEDIVGGLSMTATNSPTISAHPRVVYPGLGILGSPPGTPATLEISIDPSNFGYWTQGVKVLG